MSAQITQIDVVQKFHIIQFRATWILKTLSNVSGLSVSSFSIPTIHRVEEFTIGGKFILKYNLDYFLSHGEGLAIWRKLEGRRLSFHY